LRRARGFAPLPITLPFTCPPALAVGAHMKSTVAVNRGPDVFISQHLGDLESAPALSAFERAVEDLPRLLDLTPMQWVADAHPDYASTHFVRRQSGSRMHVQHHHAHVLACQAENEVPFPFLGIAWDGTGWGPDHTIWGGEFLLVDRDRWQRIGHLRPFRLPGAAAAAREPRRSALGLLHAYEGDPLFHRTGLPSLEAFDPVERTIVRTMLKRGLNSPVTTSVGRLFDAVASIVGIRQRNAFEGQAAMELEFAVDPLEPADAYALPWKAVPEALAEPGLDSTEDWPVGYDPTPPRWQADWGPLLDELLADLAQGVPVARMAARFHHALARVITEAARSVGRPSVVLAGGCFQNRHLLECSVLQLRAAGFRADWPQRVPPNDGGIALGQIVAAALAGAKHPG